MAIVAASVAAVVLSCVLWAHAAFVLAADGGADCNRTCQKSARHSGARSLTYNPHCPALPCPPASNPNARTHACWVC